MAPSPSPHELDYATPPPKPRPAWKEAVEVFAGLGAVVGFGFGCMSIAIIVGFWEEPMMEVGVLSALLSIASFAVSALVGRRWCNEG